MVIRSWTNDNYIFQLFFSTQEIPTAPSRLNVKFDTYPDKSASYNHTIRAVVIFVNTAKKN